MGCFGGVDFGGFGRSDHPVFGLDSLFGGLDRGFWVVDAGGIGRCRHGYADEVTARRSQWHKARPLEMRVGAMD